MESKRGGDFILSKTQGYLELPNGMIIRINKDSSSEMLNEFVKSYDRMRKDREDNQEKKEN